MKKTFLLTMMMLVLGVFSAMAADNVLSFPGADGFGKYTTGGRGGNVYYVTSTADCPDNALVKGTLRWALNSGDDSPRTVLFAVPGTIYLTSKLKMKHSNVSILGQSAPGGGVCLAGYPLNINGVKNVIVRYMRFRAGDEPNESLTGLDMENSQHVILDHCSMTWSMEECMTAYDTDSTTVQYCIIGEGLYNSKNSKGARAYAMQWGGEHSTLHHCLVTNSVNRTPLFNGVRKPSTYRGEHDYQVDSEFANNVLFNFGKPNSSHGVALYHNKKNNIVPTLEGYGEPYDRLASVNNCFIPGPATAKGCTSGRYFVMADTAAGSYYLGGNKYDIPESFELKTGVWASDSIAAVNADNFAFVAEGKRAAAFGTSDNTYEILKTQPESTKSGLTYQTADEAKATTLAGAGARLPRLDEVDTRLINEASGKVTPQFQGPTFGAAGIIDSPSNVTLTKEDPNVKYYPYIGMNEGDKYAADADYDGLPDAYETEKGLNPDDPSDAATKPDGSDYTNLEIYLNGIADGTVTKSTYETSDTPLAYPTVAATVTFAKSDDAVEGTVPATLNMSEGDTYEVIANTSLYKEGYTLTGWKKGDTTYKIGETITIDGDMTLTTVFTENKENVSERNTNYTLTWNVKDIASQMSGEGIFVSQNKLAFATIDTKLGYQNSYISVPSCQGATITIIYNDETQKAYTASSDESTWMQQIENLAEASSIVVTIPFKENTTAPYHTPECAEGKKYELLYTPGDKFTAPDWVKISGYSDASRNTYDPDKDDNATIANLESVVLKAAANNTMDVYVAGTERVRIFASGSSSNQNFLKVTAVPNDGSDLIVVQNETGVVKNSPVNINVDLDKTKSYRLFFEPCTSNTEIAIAALKVFEDTSLPTTGDATISWPLSNGDVTTVKLNPEGLATGSVSYGSQLTPSSKLDYTNFGASQKNTAVSDEQLVTFKATIADGFQFTPKTLTFKDALNGATAGNYVLKIVYGTEEVELANGTNPGKSVLTDRKYNLTDHEKYTGDILIKVYIYNSASGKGVIIGNVALSGTYNIPTAINEVNAENKLATLKHKYLKDGHLLIVNGNRTYNAAGQLVK